MKRFTQIILMAAAALLLAGAAHAQTDAEIEAAKEALLRQQAQQALQRITTSSTTTSSDSSSAVVKTETPEYPGGMTACLKYLSDNMKYPEAARNAKTEGHVIVSFYVGTDGQISDVSIEKSLSKECDEEAIRLVKGMPKWNPYKEYHADGTVEAIKCKMTLPVEFILVARDYNRVR